MTCGDVESRPFRPDPLGRVAITLTDRLFADDLPRARKSPRTENACIKE